MIQADQTDILNETPHLSLHSPFCKGLKKGGMPFGHFANYRLDNEIFNCEKPLTISCLIFMTHVLT